MDYSRNLQPTTTLTLIDGMRLPLMGTGALQYDPSIIPALGLDRIDVLADGASATYGSDAIAGVVNVILKRRYDGAMIQTAVGADSGGGGFKTDSQVLFGRTWEGGDITIAYEFNLQQPMKAKDRSYYTENFTPWGLPNDTPVNSAMVPIISQGAPNMAIGTGCTNCFSVPKGQNGTALSWAQLQANAGVANEINPTTEELILPSHQYNNGMITFDQDIFPGVQFNAAGYYANRQTQMRNTDPVITTVAIPTTNPYYPVGAPAGLVANLSFPEIPNEEHTVEITDRYSYGFTIALPANWEVKLVGSESEDAENRLFPSNLTSIVNNDVNAALGATIAATPATQGSPGLPSFTKPSSVPYLNVFCDPTAFNCIAAATLAYITNSTTNDTHYILEEYNATFDGPLFDLPAGQLKAAFGGDYSIEDFYINTITNPLTSQVPVSSPDSLGRNIWAFFGQLNVPVLGDGFNLPFVEKLDLELSDRYDRYSDFGGTNNPKFSANWMIVDGAMVRGSWGTNFVAPSFKALSAVQGREIGDINAPGGTSTAATKTLSACQTAGGAPVPGSAAAILNPTCSAANQFPTGIEIQGGLGGVGSLLGRTSIQPETAKDWSVGFELAPTDGYFGFLKGLDLDATWYTIHVDNLIIEPGTGDGNGLNDPTRTQFFILRSDPRFNALLQYAISNPLTGNRLANINTSQVQWIHDSVFQNIGSLEHDGIDFNASYDLDLGAFGAWNAGITGTYTLRNYTINIPGGPAANQFDVGGLAEFTRLKYRARIGWANDQGISAILFMDYQSHIFGTVPFPPQSYINEFPNYSNLIPAQYTFDVALGYATGDRPANDYLKRINITLAINNIFDRPPPFEFGGTGNPWAFYPNTTNPFGRNWLLTVSKQF